LNSTLIAATSDTDTAVVSGTTYYYVATAVDSGGVESAYSTEATATIP
jgi:fibronectin type 3 domain-containing protein